MKKVNALNPRLLQGCADILMHYDPGSQLRGLRITPQFSRRHFLTRQGIWSNPFFTLTTLKLR